MKKLTLDYQGKSYIQADRHYLLSEGVPEHVIGHCEFEHCKKDKLGELNLHCQSQLNQLTKTYPAGEISTFDKQEQEARAYLADNVASTPLLDALATNRNIDKAELVNRVIEKADAFATASGAIIGKRQKLEDELNALSFDTDSIADIDAIQY